MSASVIKQDLTGNSPTRKLTDAEMRVQRALKKLDIPEWYLNKKSKAPKILKNNTPIDCRQSAWKRVVKPHIMSTTCPLENTSDSIEIYSTNKRHKTSMNESLLSGSYVTPRKFENPINETNKMPEEDQSKMEHSEPMEVQKFTKAVPNRNETVKSSRAYFSLNKSYTFPRMSPSRKVQNINIVFPPTSNSPLPNLPKSNPPHLPLETTVDTDVNSNCTSVVNKLSQKFESSLGDTPSGDDRFRLPRKGNKVNPTSCFKTNLANAISPKPFSKKVNTPYGTPASNFNILANSTSDFSQQTLFTSALDKSNPSPVNSALRENTRDFSFSSNNSYYSLASRSSLKTNKDLDRKQSTYLFGEVKAFGSDCHDTCQDCGAKPPRIFAAVTKLSPNNSKYLSNEEYLSQKFSQIMGISDSPTESSAGFSDDERRESGSLSPPERFTNVQKTSTEFSNAVKMNQMQEGKDLGQEIIQELKAKCTLKSNASYSSSITKNFVNRLVNDLQEKNTIQDPKVPEEQEIELESSDTDSGSRNSSDLDINSAALSTSISVSLKDLDSGSDCTPLTSTLKSNADKFRFNKKQIPVESSPYEDDGVFWIPLRLVNLPRTSSLMSMMSKNSGSQSQSPSVSPISDLNDFNQAKGRPYQNYYEKFDCKQKYSGYLGRSSLHSRLTDSSLSNWFEESESSPTESEKSFSIKTVSDRIYLGRKSGIHMI